MSLLQSLSRPRILDNIPSTLLSVVGSPELSLILTISYTDYLQYKPVFETIAQLADTIEPSTYFLLSLLIVEAIDS